MLVLHIRTLYFAFSTEGVYFQLFYLRFNLKGRDVYLFHLELHEKLIVFYLVFLRGCLLAFFRYLVGMQTNTHQGC